MCATTVLALVYVHVQMQIVGLAYRQNVKESQIRKLIEHNGHVTHAILTLKSANHLGVELLSENSNMQFIDPRDIMQISASPEFGKQDHLFNPAQRQKKTNPLLSWLSFGAQAEAKIQE